MPLLQSIIILPDEVCPNLVIKHTLNGVRSIPDGQADHDSAHPIAVVVDHAGWRDGILDKLVTQQFLDLQFVNILVELGRDFPHVQEGRLF